MIRKRLLNSSLAAAAVAAVACAGLAGTAAVSAAVVNVQFDGSNSSGEVYTGTAAAPDTGTYWNQASGYALYKTGTDTMTDLTASDGTTATTVGFTLTSNVTSSWGAYSGSTASGSANILVDNSMYFGTTNTGQSDTASLEISGLTPGGTYDLYVYGFKNKGADSSFTLGGTTLATNGEIVNTGTPFDAADQGATWNVFKGISATPAGDISVSVNDGADSTYTFINGFQVVAASPVPEPATLGLMGVGAIGLLLMGRKRKMA